MNAPYLEALRAARHDHGKYMVFQQRWVPNDGPVGELEEALQADLLRTHRGPSGSRAAPDVWRAVREALVETAPDATIITRLDDEMSGIERMVKPLEQGSLSPEQVRELAERAISFSEQLDALYQEAREA